ncbi:DUF4174 domain-containing protein [Glaciecola sp. 2405UD65-10]|uniref:DUF4174 domain-containing protein n=1 Tax=Glaciecola sp. 2405UD65-10 TaxID=3397244 RepID=UPI003B59C157
MTPYLSCVRVFAKAITFMAYFFALLTNTAHGHGINANNTEPASYDECTELACLKWENRIVITSQKPSLASTETSLMAQQEALLERKLLIFAVNRETNTVYLYKAKRSSEASKAKMEASWYLVNSKLAKELRERIGDLHTVLIGLDGQSKVSYEGLRFNEIYRDIDGMPMRIFGG